MRVKPGYPIDSSSGFVLITVPRPQYELAGGLDKGQKSKSRSAMHAIIKLDSFTEKIGSDPKYFVQEIRDLASVLKDNLSKMSEDAKNASKPSEGVVLDRHCFTINGANHETRWVAGVSAHDLVYTGVRDDLTEQLVEEDDTAGLKFFIRLESTYNIEEKVDPNRPVDENGFYHFNIGISVPFNHGCELFESDEFMRMHKEAVLVYERNLIALLGTNSQEKIEEFFRCIARHRKLENGKPDDDDDGGDASDDGDDDDDGGRDGGKKARKPADG